MFNIGIIEFLIIIFFAVLFIKPKDLPVISKNLGLFYRKLNRYFYNLKYEFSNLEPDFNNSDRKIKNKNAIPRSSKRTKKKNTT